MLRNWSDIIEACESHTAIYTADLIKKFLSKFNLNNENIKLFTATTDWAGNMIKCVQSKLKWLHISCILTW